MENARLAWRLVLAGAGVIAAPAAAAPGDGSAGSQAPAGAVRQSSHNAPLAGERGAAAYIATAPGTSDASRNTSPTRAEKTRLGEIPSRPSNSSSGDAERGAEGLWSTLGALAAVLVLFGAAAWFLRRSLPRTSRQLPSDVIEVLGLMPLGNRQQAQLVRLGKKLLLIHVAAGHAETLTEVTDAAEVDRLTALCRDPKRAPVPNFSDVLHQFRARPLNASLQTGPIAKAAHPATRAEANDA